MHFGEKLNILLKHKKLTQRELSEALNINVQAINRYIKSDRQPRLSFLKKVSEILHVPVTYFVNDYKDLPSVARDIQDGDFIKLRVIGIVPKNWPFAAVREFMDEVYVPKRVLGKNKVYAVRANNDDMAPVIESEDYIVVYEENELTNGDVVAVRCYIDGEIKLRKYYKIGDEILFVPRNSHKEAFSVNIKNFDPDPAKGDYEILGKVVHLIRTNIV
jgi:SOS-response transcriptional repressor LexA